MAINVSVERPITPSWQMPLNSLILNAGTNRDAIFRVFGCPARQLN